MSRLLQLMILIVILCTCCPAARSQPPADAAARIAKMETIADHALVPPLVNTSPLPEYGYDRLDYGMTIGIARTPRGRLWACWVAGGDSPKAFFVLATSDDDGQTWSDPRVVLDAHADGLGAERSILVGNLWTDPRGRLWLFFDQSMHMFDGRAGVWATVCEHPDAAQPTWSKPKRIWHGVTLNKPTVLSSGEWMLPISLDQREGFGPFAGCFRELDPLRGANVFVSTDQGKTWQRRGAVRFPDPDWHEHMIVQRNDGSLWMLARTRRGIMETTSTDGGKTWSDPVESAIKHPVARFFVRRLHSGRLLLIKHGDRIDSHNGRFQLSAWLSEDDGQSWSGGLVLDERTGVSYPDGFQSADGTIYISYDRNRATDGEILLARFTEQDVLAKKLVGKQSKLKMLISRPLGLEKKLGFVPLFDGKTFTGWEHNGNWVIEDGAFYRQAKGGSLTYTAATVPDDFELRLEWKVSAGCNSGVYYRPGQVEYQILDNVGSPYGENARQSAAALFFCMAPNQDATRPVGQWNTGRVICQGTVIEHWLNGQRVISFDYTDPKWSEYVKLLAIRGGDLTGRGGRLWLQDHGQDVWFRNLRWRELSDKETITPDPDFKPLPVSGTALQKEQARVNKMLAASGADVAAEKLKIVLAGDSTVTDQAGWGSGFANALTDRATCVNLSAGGRSSKSFREEGRWQKVLEQRPAVILIQFGHNDQPGKGPLRETDPQTTYRQNLARYVDEARAIGAKPVIVTSLSRRLWAPDGLRIQSILTGYVQAAKSVAREKDVPLIDLHTRSIAIYEALGQRGCERISPRGQDEKIDRTHLNEPGGKLFGMLVANELQHVLPETENVIAERELPDTAQQWKAWLRELPANNSP